MTLGQVVTGPLTGLDRFAPAARLGALVLLAAGVAFARGPLGLSLALSVALAAFAFSRLPVRALWHRLAHVEGFLLVLLVMLPLTMPGATFVSFGPLILSQDGLVRAGVIALKVNAAVILLTALIGSLEPGAPPAALGALGVPPRLAALFGFAIRFVGLMREEADRLKDALKVRAFTPRLDRRTLATYGNLAALVVLRAHDRAARIDEAMRCRGFAGHLPARVTPAWSATDIGFVMAAGAVAALIGATSW